MGFYDFSTPQTIDIESEFTKRYIQSSNGSFRLNQTSPNYGESQNTQIFQNLRLRGSTISNLNNPFGYQHQALPIMVVGTSADEPNSVDDPPGSIKNVAWFKQWNRYRGDGTGWNILFGKAEDSCCRMEFFSDAANGRHNRMRFQTIGYDQDVYVQGNNNTLVWKDHNTLNLWGSGFVSIGETWNMPTDGANNGTASDLGKPKYHLSVERGIGSGNGTTFNARLHIKTTDWDLANTRWCAAFDGYFSTTRLIVDQAANLFFSSSSQFIIMQDAVTGVYKKARIENNIWSITNL